MTHGAVRWYTSRCATSSTIAGPIWIADAPVPINATRLPLSEASWFQRAEWNNAPANVVLDLVLRRERSRPVRVELERVRVEMRRDVAGRARVGVVTPGPADLAAPLENEEVVAAVFAQPDGGPQAGEPAADDEHLDVSPPAAVRVLDRGRRASGSYLCHDV